MSYTPGDTGSPLSVTRAARVLGLGRCRMLKGKRREEKRVFVFVLPPRAQQRPRASQVAVSHKYGERVGHIAAQF